MKNSVNWKFLIQLIIVFIITFTVNIFLIDLNPDEVWNYGFCYNISNGLIPYKDFNMVITPLFPILEAIFMSLFGKNIVIFHVFSAIICTFIFYFIKKDNPNSYYIPYAILLYFVSMPNYSLMCLLFFYVLIYMEKEKKSDILIGIILGLTFLTKQNMGIALCVPTIMYLKNIKKVLKRIVGFIIPNIFFLIYLLYNQILYYFIDYAFLGIKDFSGNFVIDISCGFIAGFSLLYLIYKFIKTKDIIVLYLICFWFLSYPLVDPYHIMIPFVPTIAFFCKNMNLNKKIINISFYILICFLFILGLHPYLIKTFHFPNETNIYKYRRVSDYTANYINTYSDFIKNNDGYNFMIDPNAYVIKLNIGKYPDKFDLLNNGNLGSGGIDKIISQIDSLCKTNYCTFIMTKPENGTEHIGQYDKKIYKYISENYTEKEKILMHTIYNNKNKKK